MGGYGYPKCICDECAGTIDTMTQSREYDEIIEACKKLGENLTEGNTDDTQIIATVNEIIKNGSERAEAIKDGSYDFSLDEQVSEEEEFDITEDLEETEEDRKKDEQEAKIANIIDTIGAWAAGLILVGAVVFFIIKFVFR